jgi:hypothetical protein
MKRTDNVKLQFQIPKELLEEMKRLLPEILDPAKPTTFRWGGLNQYFTHILLQDLARRSKALNEQAQLQADTGFVHLLKSKVSQDGDE